MFVRYDTPNEHGECRRDRNAKFGVESPELDVPEYADHLWAWFFELSDSVRRILEGATMPLAPSEIKAWAEMTGRVISPDEYATLRAMDLAWCDETDIELEAYRERLRETTPRDGVT